MNLNLSFCAEIFKNKKKFNNVPTKKYKKNESPDNDHDKSQKNDEN